MEGPPCVSIWHVTGPALLSVPSWSRPLAQSSPTDHKQSSHCLRSQATAGGHFPGSIPDLRGPGSLGDRHMPLAVCGWSAPARGPECSAPEAGITVPDSQARKQPDRPGAGLKLRLGKWSKPSSFSHQTQAHQARAGVREEAGVRGWVSSPCPGGGHGRPYLAFAFPGTESSPCQVSFTPGLAPSERFPPQLPASG